MEKLVQRASRIGGLAIYQQVTQAGCFYRVFRTRRRASDAPPSVWLNLDQAQAKVSADDNRARLIDEDAAAAQNVR